MNELHTISSTDFEHSPGATGELSFRAARDLMRQLMGSPIVHKAREAPRAEHVAEKTAEAERALTDAESRMAEAERALTDAERALTDAEAAAVRAERDGYDVDHAKGCRNAARNDARWRRETAERARETVTQAEADRAAIAELVSLRADLIAGLTTEGLQVANAERMIDAALLRPDDAVRKADTSWESLGASRNGDNNFTDSTKARRAGLIARLACYLEQPVKDVLEAINVLEQEDVRAGAAALLGRVPAEIPLGGVRFALDGDDAPRLDWLVADFRVRKFVIVHSGDSGAGKTTFEDAMMIAGLGGEKFLAREVRAKRWLRVAGEEYREEIATRWRAMGFREEDWERVRLLDQEVLERFNGDRDAWAEHLMREAEDFQPDVIVIDTVASSIPGVELLDNDAVVGLYRDVLRPLARKSNACVVLYTHESQEGAERRHGDRKSAVMGARQWVGQANAVITHVNTVQVDEADDGTTRAEFKLHVPKFRLGRQHYSEGYAFRGRRDPDTGELAELQIVGADARTNVERLLDAVPAEGEIPKGELAKALGWPLSGTRFREAYDEAVERAFVVERREGRKALVARADG